MKVLRRSPSESHFYINIPSIHHQYTNSILWVYQQYTISIQLMHHHYAKSIPTTSWGCWQRTVRCYSPFIWKHLKSGAQYTYIWGCMKRCCYHELISTCLSFPTHWGENSQAKRSSPTAPMPLLKPHPSAKKRHPRIAKGSNEIKKRFGLSSEALESQGLKTFWGAIMPQWKIPNM